MIKIAKLATAHMFDENNPEDSDYELWKSIAEYMDGENAYVVESIAMEGEYVFLGLCDRSKDKELAYMMEQDSMTGVFIDDREENCRGARKLGMHAVRFRDFKQAAADLEALGVK